MDRPTRINIWTTDKVHGGPNWITEQRCRHHFLFRRRRRRTVLQFARDTLRHSSISGISHIAKARSWVLRILWIIMFFCCLMGFSYHATIYFSLFFSYPTTVDVKVENRGILEFPAITICNNNRFVKSIYCLELPCDGGRIRDEEIMWTLNKSTRIKMGHKRDDLIVNCKLKGRNVPDENNCVKNWYLHYLPEHGNCYTFNAAWNAKNKQLIYAYDSDMWNPPTELVLDINAQYDEYLDQDRSAGVLVTFHTPDSYPDPSSETVTARAGHRYNFGMRQFTTKLLPKPYQTNCTEYNTLPWATNYNGIPHQKICTQECSRMFQLSKCECISANLTKLYEDISCEGNRAFCADDVEENTMDYCRSLCRVPCIRKSYDTSSDSSTWPKNNKMMFLKDWANRSLEDARKNLVRIKIFLKTVEHTTYVHIPKYAPVEVFSHLGGYISLWLGFSVLAVWEIIEMCLIIVHRSCCK